MFEKWPVLAIFLFTAVLPPLYYELAFPAENVSEAWTAVPGDHKKKVWLKQPE